MRISEELNWKPTISGEGSVVRTSSWKRRYYTELSMNNAERVASFAINRLFISITRRIIEICRLDLSL